MGDRLSYDLEMALSSYSMASNDDYDDEEEETDGEYEVDEVNVEEKSEELACPFCLEDFDVLGFCCHIDADHRMEVKPGICPLCMSKLGINMASHMITQHESVLKALCNKKHSSTRSRSAIILLRKELQEKHLQHIKESPSSGSSADAVADSMFLSFVNNPRPSFRSQTIKTTETGSTETSSKFDNSERIPPSLSTDKTDERSRCDFVQGLLMSAMLNDF
ncbi:protein DEHYDRATION-INDUCED 19-like [Andrographis paniculata]|uniref:protein DEHYDRATION-INDUCED 19-like n=1 Tax=Andrographis paniculata TaxID=175694 RepID=UPI0021E8DDDE|nr:protein DEHYDRATION-INDUCED 19-like [Andrographis paniculata]